MQVLGAQPQGAGGLLGAAPEGESWGERPPCGFGGLGAAPRGSSDLFLDIFATVK